MQHRVAFEVTQLYGVRGDCCHRYWYSYWCHSYGELHHFSCFCKMFESVTPVNFIVFLTMFLTVYHNTPYW